MADETTRAWREQMKAAGLCVICGKVKASPGFVTCAACRERNKQKAAERRENLKSRGLCVKCGKQPSFGKKRYCADCLYYFQMYHIEHPWEPTDEQRAHKSAYDKALRKQRKDAGLCIRCGKRPAKSNRTMCAACAEERRAYDRAWRGGRR